MAGHTPWEEIRDRAPRGPAMRGPFVQLWAAAVLVVECDPATGEVVRLVIDSAAGPLRVLDLCGHTADAGERALRWAGEHTWPALAWPPSEIEWIG